MTTVKVILIVIVSTILTAWYLSYHPRPLFVFSDILSVCVTFLIWLIYTLSRDKKQLELVRKFVINFLDTETLQSAVDKKLEEKATITELAVERSILFQKGGMEALGLADGDDISEERRALNFETLQKNIEHDVKVAKDVFWILYDLAEICVDEFQVKLKTPRSYKNYLPK